MSIVETSGDYVLNYFCLPNAYAPTGGIVTDFNVGYVTTYRWSANEQTWSPFPARPSGTRHISLRVPSILVSTERTSERENNPFDNPPGIGFKGLKASNAFITPKHLMNRTVLVENGLQLIRTTTTYSSFYGNEWEVLEFSADNPASIRVKDFPSSSPYYSYMNDLYNKALLNLYGSLEKRKKVNGGVMLAELRESMGLLGKACTQILLIVHAVKRGDIKKAIKLISEYGGGRVPTKILSREQLNRQRRRSGKEPVRKSEYASSTWLELQFGWLPILNDIYALIDYISALDTPNNKGPWLSFHGYSSGAYSDSADVSDLNWFCTYYNTTPVIESQNRVSLTASFALESPFKDVINQIGLLNPASIAWETVPFSFVLDWFLPVGDWISSFTAYSGLELKSFHMSYRRDITIKLPSPNRPNWENPAEDVVIKRFEFQRIIPNQGDPEIPPFPTVFASLEKILEPWKLITSLALFRQLRR